jgi:anti-sigma-K factor RskA
MKMRQSLAQLEQAFFEETAQDRARRERLRETAVHRSRRRQIERVHKHGSWRFAFLVLSIVVTAVVVTIAMFETLYYVMG